MEPQWFDESALVEIAFPDDLLRADIYAREARSIFRPRVAYRIPALEGLDRDGPAQAWAFVKCEMALPFIVRAHNGSGYWRPCKGRCLTSPGAWGVGVVTYFAAFGFIVEIDDWGVGF
ncbi:MAG TPA: hypothetical protein VJS92_03160 [Candidatus Polarisedimenticolaceae bacterium]|nr:hypothetical protein [Candidatus Polarisedimenticolaceae bacterium]